MLKIVAVVTGGALLVTIAVVWGVEARLTLQPAASHPVPFATALREVWAEPKARDFTLFILLSMTACFLQELILEPYAGLIFGITPGQSTGLSGAQHGGVFAGMLTVGSLASGLRIGSLRTRVMAGCLGSCAALVVIAAIGQTPMAPLTPAVVTLGFFNGMFSVAAIASMMALAGDGRQGRAGTRMGLWGAAQAMAAGFGGLVGALWRGRATATDPRFRHSRPDDRCQDQGGAHGVAARPRRRYRHRGRLCRRDRPRGFR